jgi:hypothetical protein
MMRGEAKDRVARTWAAKKHEIRNPKSETLLAPQSA